MALVVLPYGRPRDAAADLASEPLAAPGPRLAAGRAPPVRPGRRSSTTTAPAPPAPRSPVLAVAYSPDGRSLATAGEDAAIVLRDLPPARPRSRLEGHADAVTCLAFSPDGKDPRLGRLRPDGPALGRWRPAAARPTL